MYTKFFGLKEEPFRLTPDPRFLYLAEPHRVALTSVMQGILLRKGIMTIVGPVGTGKTTLLHAVLQLLTSKAAADIPTATAFLLNPTLTREELLEAILDEFDVRCDSASKPRRLSALHQMLLDTQRRGATAVLFIDEAHLLTLELLEEIRLLSNADTYREKLLQIILCGQPELLTVLDRPELRAFQQRIAHSCLLRALSLPETRTYINDRLQAAGLRSASPFPGTALEEIYCCTQGVPRLINLLCDKCLMIGFTTGRAQIGLDILEEAAVSLGMNARIPLEHSKTIPTAAPKVDKGKRTSVDIMIESMRMGRATAQE
jgi:general secretion pathway protein A